MWVMDLRKLKNVQNILTKPTPKLPYGGSAAGSDSSTRTHYFDQTASEFNFGWEQVTFKPNAAFKKVLRANIKSKRVP